ncbi:hypothetical protein CJF30_00006487 [Rutstroemia sp. NJR-2017a BBW]|nr:hypothetical protein CJF30_00006487 [Rutstroemia sp. NJR-2017a BBW]
MYRLETFAVFLLSALQQVSALPEALHQRSLSTCAPSLVTTTYVSTITTVQSVPHSCYTRTVTAVQSSFPCSGTKSFDPKTCGPVPLCLILSTTTVSVPPSDACCGKTTPTVTIPGACASCQTGCATQTETVTVTTTPGSTYTKRQEDAAATPCTTTLNQFKTFNLGPTKTIYPKTVTVTDSVDCAGCSLTVKNLGGVGPVVKFTTTVYAPGPTTTTVFACSTSA